jgi:hypothetical protein
MRTCYVVVAHRNVNKTNRARKDVNEMTDNEQTEDYPSAEAIATEIQEAEASVATAQKAHRDAVKALERDDKSDMTRIVELVDTMKAAEAQVSRSEAVLSVAKRKLEFESRRETFNAQRAFRELVSGTIDASTLEAITSQRPEGVSGAVITLDFDNPENNSCKLTGDGVVKPPSARKSSTATSNGNGVGRSKNVFTVNGTDYTSRELVEAFGDQYLTGNVSKQDVLDNPTKHGLSHVAKRIHAKLQS